MPKSQEQYYYLRGGLLQQGSDEYRELALAVAEYDRGANVTISVVLENGRLVDCDGLGADLVKRGDAMKRYPPRALS